jgi:membrane protease YdiL (CAAX protease family)
MNPDPPVSVLSAEESANTDHRGAAGRVWGFRDDDRTDHDEAPPPEQWRQENERQFAQAEAEGYHDRARRLRGFGDWQNVVVDTVLLVLVEILLILVLEKIVFGIMWLQGNYLTDGGISNATINNGVTDWFASPTGLGFSSLAAQGSMFLVLQLRVVGRGLLSWKEIGFGPALRNRAGRAFLIGLGIGVAAFVIGEILLTAMHAVRIPVNGQQEELASVHRTQILPFLFFACTASITAPIAEESFFRAYALRALTVRYTFPVGIAGSSLLFGLLHLTGGVGWVFIPLIVIGAILAWGYGRTGNPITNITAHALNNLIGVILLLTGG